MDIAYVFDVPDRAIAEKLDNARSLHPNLVHFLSDLRTCDRNSTTHVQPIFGNPRERGVLDIVLECNMTLHIPLRFCSRDPGIVAQMQQSVVYDPSHRSSALEQDVHFSQWYAPQSLWHPEDPTCVATTLFSPIAQASC